MRSFKSLNSVDEAFSMAMDNTRAINRAEKINAGLSRRVVFAIGQQQFLTVKMENNEVVPVFKESPVIKSIAEADGYTELATNCGLVEKGEKVEMFLYKGC